MRAGARASELAASLVSDARRRGKLDDGAAMFDVRSGELDGRRGKLAERAATLDMGCGKLAVYGAAHEQAYGTFAVRSVNIGAHHGMLAVP